MSCIYFQFRFIFAYDFLLTLDFFFGREIPLRFLALMLFTKEFFTPSLFFLPVLTSAFLEACFDMQLLFIFCFLPKSFHSTAGLKLS
jgi:hypothetical protein